LLEQIGLVIHAVAYEAEALLVRPVREAPLELVGVEVAPRRYRDVDGLDNLAWDDACSSRPQRPSGRSESLDEDEVLKLDFEPIPDDLERAR